MNKPTSKDKEIMTKPGHLLSDLKSMIYTAREYVAQAVNSSLMMLYWEMGKRIRQDILKEKRAGYGEEILPTLSAKLLRGSEMGFLLVILLAWCDLQRFF